MAASQRSEGAAVVGLTPSLDEQDCAKRCTASIDVLPWRARSGHLPTLDCPPQDAEGRAPVPLRHGGCWARSIVAPCTPERKGLGKRSEKRHPTCGKRTSNTVTGVWGGQESRTRHRRRCGCPESRSAATKTPRRSCCPYWLYRPAGKRRIVSACNTTPAMHGSGQEDPSNKTVRAPGVTLTVQESQRQLIHASGA